MWRGQNGRGNVMAEESKPTIDTSRRPSSSSHQSLMDSLRTVLTKRVVLSASCLALTVCFVSTVLIYRALSAANNGRTPYVWVEPKAPTDGKDVSFEFEGESEFVGGDAELKFRVDELHRIRLSVLNELRSLEGRRRGLRQDLSDAHQQFENLQEQLDRKGKELSGLQSAIEQAKLTHREVSERNRPAISLPLPLYPISEDISRSLNPPKSPNLPCTMASCFDYSRCSITSRFPVFIYDPADLGLAGLRSDLNKRLYEILTQNPHRTAKPEEACIFILLANGHSVDFEPTSLPYWRGDGRNHVIIGGKFKSEKVGRAVRASADLEWFRPGFDTTLPPLEAIGATPGDQLWKELPPLFPLSREIYLSYQSAKLGSALGDLKSALLRMAKTNSSDVMRFDFDCEGTAAQPLCATAQEREALLRRSTFALIIAPAGESPEKSSISLQTRFLEALRSGAVPVILGSYGWLPFSEQLDFDLVCLRLPSARLPELHFLLRAITPLDLLEMKRRGRLFLQHYLGSEEALMNTVVAFFRTRLGIPALPVPDFHGRPLFANDSFSPPNLADMKAPAEPDEYLGPMEPPYASPSFEQNFTLLRQGGYALWNDHFAPHSLYPQLPYTESGGAAPATEARFRAGTSLGFRPISEGRGGSGEPFSQSLGGNLPREQFTVVMLTYEREQVLIGALQRLNEVPYLNKVIVVWNGPTPPSADLVWPRLRVPLVFIRSESNSLNNRFLPYEQIDTAAVLSLDDDVHLTPAEMVFAFRVWREARDRIVGFPGRFHEWDGRHGAWLYNSNHSCELSMVLTGAAFIHRYYLYAYTQEMPSAIREMVDELVNCEDLAMNFLVAHRARKPPIKVTSKWTFRCPGCPEKLSQDESHFLERHRCMQFFTQVYGYNPLLNTQFRVDSVLFKTRLPHQHQKCFRFI